MNPYSTVKMTRQATRIQCVLLLLLNNWKEVIHKIFEVKTNDNQKRNKYLDNDDITQVNTNKREKYTVLSRIVLKRICPWQTGLKVPNWGDCSCVWGIVIQLRPISPQRSREHK